MQDLKQKHAVITGGASGIGRAIAERLLEEEARVTVADVEQSALDKAVAEMRESGGEVTGVVTDVSSFESVQELERRATETYGLVHILCNNAGVGPQEDAPIWDLPLSDWGWTFSVNVWGVVHGIKAFLPAMLAHGEEGHVVNTSSGNGGLILVPWTPIYSTSKSAVSTLTETLHLQLLQAGARIRASVLYPGPNMVSSNIFTAVRNRPERYKREVPQVLPPLTLEAVKEMLGGNVETTEPVEVAEHFLEGIRNDAYYILPGSQRLDAAVRERTENVLQRRNPQPAPM
jgi:NAD(P)-dependent dehydrogenase (short-subunit alcohol dehydrogenase family)